MAPDARADGWSTAATRSASPPRSCNRALPNLLTILGWRSCDHLGPVFEGDTLRSTVELEALDPLPSGGALLHLRSRVVARGEPGEDEREVLDWRLFGAMA